MPQINRSDITAKLFLVILMSFSISQALYTSLFMTQKLSLIILLAVMPLTLLLDILFRNKMSSLVSAIFIVFMLIIFLSLVLLEIEAGRGTGIYEYFDWITRLANDQWRSDSEFYTNITEMITLFIVTLLIFLFTVKFYNFIVISFFGLAIFFVQLQFQFFSSNTSYVLFVFSFLLYYLFTILRRRKKALNYDVGNRLKYIIFIIPVCIIVLLISFLLPPRDNRISLPWLDKKADTVVADIADFFNERFSGDGNENFGLFSLGTSGFGNDDRLGGNIKLDNTRVMTVKSEHPNLYLRGSSKAKYDGHRWFNESTVYEALGNDSKTYSDQINSDANEFQIGNFMMTGNKSGDNIFKSATAEIKYEDLSTKSLFMPPKAFSLTLDRPLTLFYDSEKMISTNEKQNNLFEYTVDYDYLMLNSDELKNNLRMSYIGFYREHLKDYLISEMQALGSNGHKLSKVVKKDSALYLTVDGVTIDKFYRDVNYIYDKYTQLPATITERVRQLAVDITNGKLNTYDKAKAIESYLSTYYPYTLIPGKAPKKQDFVDYFLFDGKKGYCTYYASAMTIMLRCIGIPARYVEGYILPPAGNNGVYDVTNQQAHAWVEAYFEGFGWIPFEPTSPFVANMYNDKNVSANISSDMKNDEYLKMLNGYRNEPAAPSTADSNKTKTDTTEKSADKPAFKMTKGMIGWIVISLLLIAALAVTIINRLRYRSFIKKLMKSDPNTAALLAYGYILKLLTLQKLPINAGETPSQFGERVQSELGLNGFVKITNYFTEARYSQNILDDEAKHEMVNFIKTVRKFTSKRLSIIKLILFKYILGKM